MALEGLIREFGVADILQLMSQQQKTGVLVVEKNRDESAEIYFLQGEVTDARRSHEATRIGNMFVKANLIKPEDLERVLERQKETYEFIGQMLFKEGLLKQEDLERVVLTHVYEIIFDILQWREGSYRFVGENAKTDPSLPKLPALETILLDVLRMIDEWPELRSRIRSFDMVIRKCSDKDEKEVEDDELPVYRLIDDTRTVGDVIAGSLLDKYTAVKVLVGLIDDGFVELAEPAPANGAKEPSAFFRKCAGVGSYAGICLVCIVLFAVPSRFPKSIVPFLSDTVMNISRVSSGFGGVYARQLRYAVEMHRLRYGTYPESIEDLSGKDVVSAEAVNAIIREGIVYVRKEEGYRIAVNN